MVSHGVLGRAAARALARDLGRGVVGPEPKFDWRERNRALARRGRLVGDRAGSGQPQQQRVGAADSSRSARLLQRRDSCRRAR